MAKICSNCACYEVCFMANPCRTEDCNINWQPIIVRCKDCLRSVVEKGSLYYAHWLKRVNEDDFCSYGERKDNG